MSTVATLQFSALDTWFFRESRPLESIGAAELASVFPPPPRTLLGAVRTLIGDALGCDWQAYSHAPQHYSLPDGRLLAALIGTPESHAPLRLEGPWLVWRDGPLYSLPRCVLARGEGAQETFLRLKIGAPLRCHIGQAVRLPALAENAGGARALEQTWVDAQGMAALLAGGVPSSGNIFTSRKLFSAESRLGIARDNSRRVVETGLLYQTRHLRPHAALSVQARLQNLPADLALDGQLLRLGGEGRLAHVASINSSWLPAAPEPDTQTRGLILMLLTPGNFSAEAPGWLPPGFQPQQLDGATVWRGQIAGIDLTVHAAVTGKALREGGWNVAKGTPRPNHSLVPAGSCYYASVAGDLRAAIAALHGAQTGADTALGRGQLACGLWQITDFSNWEINP